MSEKAKSNSLLVEDAIAMLDVDKNKTVNAALNPQGALVIGRISLEVATAIMTKHGVALSGHLAESLNYGLVSVGASGKPVFFRTKQMD
jgi:hypothetical protein